MSKPVSKVPSGRLIAGVRHVLGERNVTGGNWTQLNKEKDEQRYSIGLKSSQCEGPAYDLHHFGLNVLF